MKLKGKDYLPVAFRILWLRTEHPEAIITTTLERLELAEQFALFKAEVSIPGQGSATGWGSETFGDFNDWIEKAETKSLGRALAALGYGTQFCDDHSEDLDRGHVVDNPVARPAPPARPAPARQGPDGPLIRPAGESTPAQQKAIYLIARNEQERNEQETDDAALALYGVIVPFLTKRQASDFIDRLKAGTVAWEPAFAVDPLLPGAKGPAGEKTALTGQPDPTEPTKASGNPPDLFDEQEDEGERAILLAGIRSDAKKLRYLEEKLNNTAKNAGWDDLDHAGVKWLEAYADVMANKRAEQETKS